MQKHKVSWTQLSDYRILWTGTFCSLKHVAMPSKRRQSIVSWMGKLDSSTQISQKFGRPFLMRILINLKPTEVSMQLIGMIFGTTYKTLFSSRWNVACAHQTLAGAFAGSSCMKPHKHQHTATSSAAYLNTQSRRKALPYAMKYHLDGFNNC